MARTYERWDRVRAMTSPGGYVYRVAVNLNRRRLRRLGVRARRLLVLGGRTANHPSPEGDRELFEALASLSRGQREAFALVEWLGLSSEEAGQMLGLAPASVRSRVHRARARLRDRLDPGGDDDG
jgi:RNA polymerase sigma-70 factor (ECF subfamily)